MKGFLTTTETAQRLNLSGARIRKMIQLGVIRKTEKAGRNHLIPEREIKRLEEVVRKAGRPLKRAR